ncbi:hypothetical protein [Actinoplanes sp. DH11]|uniref:hypothetical protein n=1 Tax=Actinoplanes sp. DH11 TaxID=2857011 RepID=UPI001E63577C|nr:hypothetical protein [Actinoplanes sp. DH11]
MIVAHGVGQSADLPLPLDLVLQAGAATVVLSFLIAALLRRRLPPADPAPSLIPSRVAGLLRLPVLVLTLYLVGSAFVPSLGALSPVAHALFVWLWVGLVPLSIVFGPVWRAVNPLRTLFAVLRLPRHGLRPLPPGRGAGAWPAAGFLLAFVWFELVAPHHGAPVAVGSWIIGYGLAQLAMAALRGVEWFGRGDCFEVYSSLAGRLSPLHRGRWLSGLAAPLPGVSRPGGSPPAVGSPSSAASGWAVGSHLPAASGSARGSRVSEAPRALGASRVSGDPRVLRAPRVAGASRLPAGGAAAFLAVWWGSTVFDSAAASPAWAGFVQRAGWSWLWGTAALTLICGLVFLAVDRTAGRLDVTASLIPIAVGYTLAHYLSLLLVEGPRGALLLIQQWGAAAGAGWDVTPIPEVVAAAQIALILIGHVLGVIVAHDHALTESPGKPTLAVLADELPMVLFMIGCTWAGLLLLFAR